MPLLSICTSADVPADKADALLKQVSGFIARELGKPEKYVMTTLRAPVPMTFGGSSDPACYVELKSIGTFASEQTKLLSAELCTLLGAGLGVSPDRIYIEFADAERHLWGYNGGTFA